MWQRLTTAPPVVRLLASAPARRTKAVLESRSFRVTSGVATVGCVGWEVVGFFAKQHEAEPGQTELVLGLEPAVRAARREKEARFRALLQEARSSGTSGAGAAAARSAQAAHQLLYPTLTPEELRARRETYGAVRWTEAALKAVAAETPLVELGAGRGQWQRALSALGADVLAYDDMSSPGTRSLRPVGEVRQGNEEAAGKHGDRALLLVYPNPGPMAARCLERYRGGTLVYVGEPRGGVNGDDAFFDALGRDWVLAAGLEVDALPDCHERAWILRRAAR